MQNKRLSSKAIVGIVLLLVLYIILLATFIFVATKTILRLSPSGFSGRSKETEIRKLIDKNFYKIPDENSLEEGIYRGLIEGLDDPYSSYFSKEEYDEYSISATGMYGGIGAVLTQDVETNVITITRLYENSPAEKSGLRQGDTIISADGNVAVEYDLSTFVTYIRGEIGTNVSIVYSRDGKEYQVDITREEIITPSVAYEMLDENTGYVQITEFQQDTENEFLEAIQDLEKSGMENVIYDLRSNPGGLVNSVTDILDDMMGEAVTLYIEDRHGNREEYTSDEENKLDYPCIVLVNGSSASASEIFAGAVKDLNYGLILGTTTYGKGTVQNIFKLSDGSAVKITIAEYFTPSGVNIHGIGITPDIILEYEYLSENEDEEYTWEKDNQVLKALELLD